jgi:hypothetical protein
MFGYKLIFQKVWSNNIFLIPCSKIRDGKNYLLSTNEYKHWKYRLLPKIIKEK